MKASRLLVITLITSSLLFLAAPGPGPVAADEILPDGCLGNITDDQVVVYYFHRKFKCGSCEVIEATLRPALQSSYGSHFVDGRLAMCVVNIDDPMNRPYLEQYQLLSTSLVIVKKRAGKVTSYQHLDAVWDVSQDEKAISNLLQRAVLEYLSEG